MIKKARGLTFVLASHPVTGWGVRVTKLLEANIRPRIDGDVCEAGVRVDLTWGTIRRPIPRFFTKAFWSKDKYKKNSETNAWNSGNHWFVLTIPWALTLFTCVLFGKWGKNVPGGYLGGRTAWMNDYSHYLAIWRKDGEVKEWAKNPDGSQKLAWGELSEGGNLYIEPTVTIRKDMMH